MDKNNVALLTINRTANGSITSIVDDRYGRSVYYHVGTYATQQRDTAGYAAVATRNSIMSRRSWRPARPARPTATCTATRTSATGGRD